MTKLPYVHIVTTLNANMAYYGAPVYLFIFVVVQWKCRDYDISWTRSIPTPPPLREPPPPTKAGASAPSGSLRSRIM